MELLKHTKNVLVTWTVGFISCSQSEWMALTLNTQSDRWTSLLPPLTAEWIYSSPANIGPGKKRGNTIINSILPRLLRHNCLVTTPSAPENMQTTSVLITGRICAEQTNQKYSYPHSENPKDDTPLTLEGKFNSLNNCSWKTDYLAYLYPAFPFRFYSTAWRTSPHRLTRSRVTHNLLTLIKLDVADRLDLVLLVFVQYHLLPAGISIYSTEVKSKKRKTLSSF